MPYESRASQAIFFDLFTVDELASVLAAKETGIDVMPIHFYYSPRIRTTEKTLRALSWLISGGSRH
jgi:hypothetical protein